MCERSGKHLLQGKGLHTGERGTLCAWHPCSLPAWLTSEHQCLRLHARLLPAPLRAGSPPMVVGMGLALGTSRTPAGWLPGSIPQGGANGSLAGLQSSV